MAIETPAIIDGQLVENTDLNLISDATTGFAGDAVLGITADASVNFADAPLTVVAGGGLQVTVGGTGQHCLVQGHVANYFPATNYSCATASLSNRYDLLCFQYEKISGDPYTADVLDTSGNITTGVTVYHTYRSAQFQIVSGTPGSGSPPSPPAGWASVASILVPASSTSVSTITMLLPTMGAALAAVIQSAGYTFGGTLSSSDGSITITPGAPTNLVVSAAGKTSINGLVGALTLESTDGSVSITQPNATHINLAVVSGASNTTAVAANPAYLDINTAVYSGTLSISLAIPNRGTSWYVEAQAIMLAYTDTTYTFNQTGGYNNVGIQTGFSTNAGSGQVFNLIGAIPQNDYLTFTATITDLTNGLGGGGSIFLTLKAMMIA